MLCRAGERFPTTHEHSSVAEARRCWSRVYSPASTPPSVASAPPSPPPVATVPPPPAPSVRMVSARQLEYVNKYNGDYKYASKLTYDEAYEYVNKLIQEHRQNRQGSRMAKNPKLDIIKGMIDMIPEGYYAAQNDTGHVDFLRLSRPTKGEFRNAVKVQTQHSEKWQNALVLWPSGQWSVYRWNAVDIITLVVVDYKTCARRYAIELQSCMRCNKLLTDDRSRHYLVGPECETKHNFTWPIAYADEQNGGMSFEQLVARGLPTRIWQDQVA